MEQVVLVDEQDRAVSSMEKLEAHRQGVLHRAFSIFLFSSSGEVLLQQRAAIKYHSGGLWTNTCCGHPRPGEEVSQAASRRLMEEMGIQCPLLPLFVFTYRAEFLNGLIEHEIDHVLYGTFDGVPSPSPDEVQNWSFTPCSSVLQQLKDTPDLFTPWFLTAFPRVCDHLKGTFQLHEL